MDVKLYSAFEVMREAIETDFADQCRLHDQILTVCNEHWQIANHDHPQPRTVAQNEAAEQALAFGRLADAVKAIMLVQFPVAAREWHGPERN